jgi:hypothetical protein
MRRLGKIATYAAGILALCVLAHANDSNPYAMIAERNVFGLVQPEAVVPPPAPEAPLPRLVPQGIMTVFGRLQVIFKMTTQATPEARARELYFVLGEGEHEDGVKVLSINPTAESVTFNNHGTVQQFLLTDRK